MKKRLLSTIIIVSLIAPIAYAEDITFSLGQKEYYFKVGEEAVIGLESDNSYKEDIDGMLSYTITQSVNQGNFQYSSSNSKSTNFRIAKGKSEVPLNFGTSDTPMKLSVSLRFSYTEDESRETNIDNIDIFFVEDSSQKNNQKNKISSSSQKVQSSQQAQQQDPFAKQQKQMEQMVDQMFGNQQQPKTAQQRLQNNQLSQDSSALKKQMQDQIQEQQQMKQEFQRELEKNQELLKEHQELLGQGFNLTGAGFDPESKNTGSFELNYQNQKGQQASLKGQLDNGTLRDLQKNTLQSRQDMLRKLQENGRFQEYQKQLQDQGFYKQDMEISQQYNRTNIKLNYKDQENKTASIKAELINNSVEKVELIGQEKDYNHWWIWALILILALIVYVSHKKLRKKEVSEGYQIKKSTERPFDYRKESLEMLEKAKKLFEKKEYKDAYGKAAQALRLFLSYDQGLKKEITNDEIIRHLKESSIDHKETKECFDLCSLVEFARYKANKKDFEKIVSCAKKVISP